MPVDLVYLRIINPGGFAASTSRLNKAHTVDSTIVDPKPEFNRESLVAQQLVQAHKTDSQVAPVLVLLFQDCFEFRLSCLRISLQEDYCILQVISTRPIDPYKTY